MIGLGVIYTGEEYKFVIDDKICSPNEVKTYLNKNPEIRDCFECILDHLKVPNSLKDILSKETAETSEERLVESENNTIIIDFQEKEKLNNVTIGYIEKQEKLIIYNNNEEIMSLDLKHYGIDKGLIKRQYSTEFKNGILTIGFL